MQYKSVFSISFNADDDRSAQDVAHAHHEQMRDRLMVEGADHPHELTLEQVLAIDPSAARALLPDRASKPILG